MIKDSLPASAPFARKPRQSLRDYQRELADRTTSAKASALNSPRQLGFLAAGRGRLIDLGDAAEIMPLPPVTPVPGTQPWFLGLINHRGRLTGVIDFGRFLGHESPPNKASGRLIVLSDRFTVSCSLCVTAVSGLMDLSVDLSSPECNEEICVSDTATTGNPAWQGPGLRINGREWHRLDVRALMSDSCFSDAALR